MYIYYIIYAEFLHKNVISLQMNLNPSLKWLTAGPILTLNFTHMSPFE